MYSELLLAWVIGLTLIYAAVHFFKNLNKKERKSLLRLFMVSYSAILLFGFTSYITLPEKEKNKYTTWYEYINNYNGSLLSEKFMKMILIGFVSGLVFGIIDNTGLWFGMEAIDPILPKGTLTRAGYGNVYADTLSAFLSTFAGKIISNLVGMDMGETPLWASAIGTTSGCLLGLHISKAISGRI